MFWRMDGEMCRPSPPLNLPGTGDFKFQILYCEASIYGRDFA